MITSGSARYPFAAVAGHQAAKRALLLLAVEPDLRGVLIASGSAKCTLARAFCDLLPEIWKPDRLTELPLNVTVDRLLGGIDLERTMASGKRHVSAGLLARANGRILYVDDINLLDADTATHIAHALDSRLVRVEREGLSATHAASFILVGTFNPAEGEPSSLLRDRVGLIVESSTEYLTDERVEIIDRELRFEADPVGFVEAFALETADLKSVIEGARAQLRRVKVSEDQMRQIALISMNLGVEGNRADVFALKAARANAALAGRDTVSEDDLVVATELALVPRATTLPLAAEKEAGKQNEPSTNSDQKEHLDGGNRERDFAGSIEDNNFRAIDVPVPENLLSGMKRIVRASGTGKRFKPSASNRGRYVRSTTKRTNDARVALDATLRAAAPFQLQRRLKSGSREASSVYRGGLKERRAPVPASCLVKIEKGDVRYKEFRQRSGILFIFAVDASGSMALNRMAQAKGALTRLLGQAYLHRDKVALISIRGEGSEVLLAPTRSVELAKRLVHALPAGGGTPISAGIVRAIDIARLARLQGMSQAMLVLFTDGRANVGLRGCNASTISDELKQLGHLLHSEGITSTLVDTKSRFLSSGEGCALAQTLGARYFYLPRYDAEAVYEVIAGAAGRQFNKRTNHD